MMGLLTRTTRVTGVAEGGDEVTTVTTEPDGKRLQLLALIVVAFGAFATVLYLADKDGGAATMLAVVTGVLSGGFGVVLGEKSGAADAAEALKR